MEKSQERRERVGIEGGKCGQGRVMKGGEGQQSDGKGGKGSKRIEKGRQRGGEG